MKKFRNLFALFLAVLMVMGSFVITAAAEDTDVGRPDPIEERGLHMEKYVSDDKSSLVLEAYAKGEVTITEKTVPCDIVLVLDVSYSMSTQIVTYTYTEVTKTSFTYNDITGWNNPTYYYYDETNGQYYQVFGRRSLGLVGYYGLFYNTNHQLGSYKSDDDDVIFNGTLYTRTRTSISRLDALKNAVSAFIDNIAEKAKETETEHRISIVTFASRAKSNVDELTSVVTGKDGTQASNLKNTVNGLAIAWGDNSGIGWYTRPDLGMSDAKSVLDTTIENGKYPEDRAQVVVMFTDGSPNEDGGTTNFDGTIANNTIGYSKTLKGNFVKVYTIGVFDNTTDNINNYMNGVSSNYPEATAYNNLGKSCDEYDETDKRYSETLDYYMTADSADELTGIFTSIAEETGGASTTIGESAVVCDVISPYFTLPENAKVEDIKVYTADYDADNDTFDDPKAASMTVSIDKEKKTIDVSGFDFSAHWCGPNATEGQKLIVEIPIEPDPSVPLDDVEDKYKLPTNSSTSGIYDGDTLVASFPSPKIDIGNKVYTVVHCGNTTDSELHTTKVYPYVEGYKVDFTALTNEGTLYGGTFTDEDCTEAVTTNPMEFAPQAGGIYYIWEVSEDYLQPKNISIYGKINGKYEVKNVFLISAIENRRTTDDGENKAMFKDIGFEINGEDVKTTVKDSVAYEQVKITQSGESTDYTYKTMYGKDLESISKYTLLSFYKYTDYERDPDASFTFIPYWITLDGVKVFGTAKRTASYQGTGFKELSVTNKAVTIAPALAPADPAPVSSAPARRLLSVMSLASMDEPSTAVVTTTKIPDVPAEPVIDEPVVEEPVVEEPVVEEPVNEEEPAFVYVVDGIYRYNVSVDNASAIVPKGQKNQYFAGWYLDKNYKFAADLDALDPDATIYAKYLSNAYLGLEYTDSVLFREMTVVSAIGSGNYKETGFLFEVNGEVTRQTAKRSSLYGILSARVLFGSKVEPFADMMMYTFSLNGLKNKTAIKVTPYWVTTDGTMVTGETRTLTYTVLGVKG